MADSSGPFHFLAQNVWKILKKLVKSNGFWKINAIRPKIKEKRG